MDAGRKERLDNLSHGENQPGAAEGLHLYNADTSLNVTSFKMSSEHYGQLVAFPLLLSF